MLNICMIKAFVKWHKNILLQAHSHFLGKSVDFGQKVKNLALWMNKVWSHCRAADEIRNLDFLSEIVK